MSPSATPATQSAAVPRATNGAQARHQTQPSARSATPATPNAGGCEQVARLPRKCHTCHASATPATQNAGRWCVTMLCAEEEAERDRTPQKDVGKIHHLAR